MAQLNFYYNEDREFFLDDVFARTRGRCHFCWGKLHRNDYGTHGWHISHLVAVASGGGDELSNLAPAHAQCNIGAGWEEDDRGDLIAHRHTKTSAIRCRKCLLNIEIRTGRKPPRGGGGGGSGGGTRKPPADPSRRCPEMIGNRRCKNAKAYGCRYCIAHRSY